MAIVRSKSLGVRNRKRKRDLKKSLRGLVRADKGEVSGRIFVDPEIYKLEQERVFGKAWLFVAHDSEMPKPGDFVTRKMGEDPVIVWRGQDGKVRVFLNVCRHRGRKVCGEDLGCAAQFRCPYHGWTYSNKGELIAVPFYEGYQGRLDKGELGLYEAPRVESYGGMVFASWEKGKGSLGDYLGEMKWVMDLMFRRSDGMEVVGAPMRWEVDANWKLGAANFAGDGHHTFVTHGFQSSVGLELIRGHSYSLQTENGHTASFKFWKTERDENYCLALPRELWPEMERTLKPDQWRVLESLSTLVGNIFPNMSFLDTTIRLPEELRGLEQRTISFLTVRQWQPKEAGKMEVWSWLLMDRNVPPQWREASKECYLRSFGMAGIFEQDDAENWGEITRALRGGVARRLWLQYKMGLKFAPATDWPGSVRVYAQPNFSELNERVFYDRWLRLIRLQNH